MRAGGSGGPICLNKRDIDDLSLQPAVCTSSYTYIFQAQVTFLFPFYTETIMAAYALWD